MIDTPPTQNTSKPTVEHIFTTATGFFRYQLNNFQCVFPFLSNGNHTLHYQIYWYIDDVNAFVSDAVEKEEFDKTYLNENNGILKMGIRVHQNIVYFRVSYLHSKTSLLFYPKLLSIDFLFSQAQVPSKRIPGPNVSKK